MMESPTAIARLEKEEDDDQQQQSSGSTSWYGLPEESPQEVPIKYLPHEVLELILEDPDLNIETVLNLALSCKHLYRVVRTSNKLWKTKFFQRWPHLREVYAEYEQDCKVRSWLHEVKTSIECRRKLMHQLDLMSAKYYKKQELSHSEFVNFEPLFRPEFGAHQLAYHFLVDELMQLIERPISQSNLTNKYYAYKVIRYMKQHYLSKEWYRFIKLPAEKQTLEKGATIVAQWSQPERRFSYNHVCGMLDDIVEQAKVLLKERHPTHPLFGKSAECLEMWRCNNIDDNQWPVTETRQVMSILCEIMFGKLGFHGNSDMYYTSENIFIDRVLERKHGIPITLSIIYESICRRVGVKCEPISFPAHFLLRWKEKYKPPESETAESYYIDVFNGGQFISKQSCPRIGGGTKCPIERYNVQSAYAAASAAEVVVRMANNLEVAGRQRTHLNGRASRLRSALELLQMVRPHDTGTILHLARFYMLHQMDLDKLIIMLTDLKRDPEFTARGPADHILQMLQDYEKHMNVITEEETEVKIRTPEVKYAIGMIMKHQRYGYLCVITGWDLRCKASPQWMLGMGVQALDGGANQPFYNVFADDGSSRYAAQENLLMAPVPGWVNHYETGRYFCGFKGTHYVPNEEKAKEYPQDNAVRDKLLTEYE